MINEGDSAPKVSLLDQDGHEFSLQEYFADQVGVVFFYPQDNSFICEREVCAFRDHFEEFTSLGAKIVGISHDAPRVHAGFRERNHLQFPLLSDRDGAARDGFGVGPEAIGMGMIAPGRVTFVIDRDGIVRRRYSSFLAAETHADEALNTTQSLALEHA